MANPNPIARLYPFKDDLNHVRDIILASPFGRPPVSPVQETSAASRSRDERETTEPPELEKPVLNKLPYLEFRFSHTPRGPMGLVFGKDPVSTDICLPNLKGISRHQFALTYKTDFADGLPRLIVRDLGSTRGTIVMYEKQGKEERSKFNWIIDGYDLPNRSAIVIRAHKHLRFLIVVNHHRLDSPTYQDNVRRFSRGMAPETLLGDLGVRSGPETEANTYQPSPGNEPMLLLDSQIAQGGFGVVFRYWDASTGKYYAGKKPSVRYLKATWEREIKMLKDASHDHIVRYFHHFPLPFPMLFMEYMPLGNLEAVSKEAPITPTECLVILAQCASALAYLHGAPNPIAHRDIKPENILVQRRGPDHNPGGLCVKLSDFGFAKDGEMQSWCGTRLYVAPEVTDNPAKEKYTTSVDIWSLGIVILRYTYGMPPFHKLSHGTRWYLDVIKLVNNPPAERRPGEILKRMLVWLPDQRFSASECFHQASALLKAQGHFMNPALLPGNGPRNTGKQIQRPAQQHQAGPSHVNPMRGAATPAGPPHPVYRGGSDIVFVDLTEGVAAPVGPAQQHQAGPSHMNPALLPGNGPRSTGKQIQGPAQQHQAGPSHMNPRKGAATPAGPPHPVYRGGPDIVFVMVLGLRISMRISDRLVNVSEILSAAGVGGADRVHQVKKLRRYAHCPNISGQVWTRIDFCDDLARELNLEAEIRGLRLYRPEGPVREQCDRLGPRDPMGLE
ncbi:kinase-like domain-containing protein [Xylaria palmicola]|nr:kinase-like domain-containing protein [Xylaria palmicola]